MKAIFWWWFDLRCSVAGWFMRRALAVMPRTWSVRDGLLRGLAEQKAYDSYAGYTLLCGCEPWPFDKWREVARTMRTRPASRCRVHDTSCIHVVRETAA
jgi:hypothetical protein